MDELLVWWKFSCLDYVEDIGILSCGIVDIGIEVRHVHLCVGRKAMVKEEM